MTSQPHNMRRTRSRWCWWRTITATCGATLCGYWRGHYRVEAVSDGAAALEAVRRQRPELVLSDVMMPRLDGFGLLRGLRADPDTATIPVILLSARAGEESRVEGMEAGADDYLVKPFSARELLARVRALLQITRLRRESEQAIRQSEERFRVLFETMSEGFATAQVVTDKAAGGRDLRYLDVNPAFERHTGLKRDEILGRTILELFPDAEPVWFERYGEVSRTGVPAHFRARFGRLGRWFEVSAYRTEPGQVATVFFDITERREAELGRQMFVSLAENSHEFVCICGLNGMPVFVNEAGMRLVGLDGLEQATRTHVKEFFFPEDRAFVLDELFPRVLAEGHGEVEIRFRHFSTGEPIWMVFSVIALRGEDGKIDRIATVSLNITDRKRAEESIRRRSEQLRRLSEVATRLNAALDIASITGIITEEARTLIGSHQAVTGFTIDQNWAQAINTVSLSDKYARWRGYDTRPDGSGIYSLVCQTNKPMRLTQDQLESHPAYQRFGRHAPDHPPMRGWLAAPLVGRDGRNIGLLQLSDKEDGDFTEEDEAILVQLAQMASVAVENSHLVHDLREQDRRKDEFLATLAHELRNPLAPLRNGLQIMKLAGGDGRAVERSRAMMERQVEQMAHLIDDLMDLSRISRGKIALQTTRMRLAQAVEDAVETSRPLIERQGHEFVLDVPHEPIFVDGDGTRLAQVFANLLNNAAKYTEPGGRIRLGIERQGSEVVVRVEDSGVGIPAHMLSRVFDMFTQVDRSLEKSQGGLGIGLNIVKRLVEMHGGSIEARSGGHGMGSTFVVRLPVVLAVTPDRPDDCDEKVRTAARRRILVVDDNRDGATSLAEMLNIMGNETQAAHDGLEAVALAEAFRPDVILMDIGMPRLNGYDACRRIREQPWGKDIAIVAQTGWGQEDDKQKSQEAGFDLHMVKPVNPAELEKLLAGMRATTG